MAARSRRTRYSARRVRRNALRLLDPAFTMAHERARIEQLWDECRTRFGADGPWLFGDYSAADAMYAPVVLRLRTYGAQVRESTKVYMATVLGDPHMRDWLSAAAAERRIIED